MTGRLVGHIAWLFVGLACAPSQGATIATYTAGNNLTAFTPAQWGWESRDIFGAGDPQGHSVYETLGGAAPAWQVADFFPNGTSPRYYQGFSTGDLSKIRADGWRMTANARLVTPSAAEPSLGLGVYLDNTAYLLQLDLKNDALYAYLWDTNTPSSSLSRELARGAAATAYHDFELRWSPATQLATLFFDGQKIIDWDGVLSTHGPDENQFQFGASMANGSGVMNFRQVDFASLESSPATHGDFNGDGQVDGSDYAVWRRHLGKNTSIADGNGDGRVTIADYQTWRENYGLGLGQTGLSAQTSPLPAPATLGLGVLVSICVATPRSRR